MFSYALIKTNGDVVLYSSEDYHFELSTLQKLVDGYIDIVQCRFCCGAMLVVDDEGLLKNKPINRIASFLYGDWLVGDVVLCTEFSPSASDESDVFLFPKMELVSLLERFSIRYSSDG